MRTYRNTGLIGSSDSGVSEVFAAILRVGITPSPPEGAAVLDDIHEQEVPKPYDPKKRKKLFKDLE